MFLPSLYAFYTSDGIQSGLSENFDSFILNNKSITILSGSIHYFRVPPEYWKDRLRKIRLAGLNTIETYIPWMLHEPYEGVFDFGNGSNEMSQFLDLNKFFKLVQEEDLFAIARIGPYICSEMDFGGLPSWLLNKPNVKLRNSDGNFLNYVKKFFNSLIPILTLLQFTYGGSIIGFQVENEYLQFSEDTVDYKYINSLVNFLVIDHNIKEMIFLADDPSTGNINLNNSKVLNVGNFGDGIKTKMKALKSYLRGRPTFIMEFWTGWYDIWLRNKRQVNYSQFEDDLRYIFKSHSSINFYMFVGGTTYGFLNGATGIDTNGNEMLPIGNSYDFDAPINESGDLTWKYFVIKRVVEEFFKENFKQSKIFKISHLKGKISQLKAKISHLKPKIAYKTIPITSQIKLFDLLPHQRTFYYKNLIPMEHLPINNNSGQSYGYIIYRKPNISIQKNSKLKIYGFIKDLSIILINGELISKPFLSKVDIYSFGYPEAINSTLTIQNNYTNATLDIIVVNLGRASYGNEKTLKSQNKGLFNNIITLNNIPLDNWEIIPMEFKKTWLKNLSKWKEVKFLKGPILYKAILNVSQPFDTFIDMSNWHMGIVIINGFVLSRYLRLGPTQSVFLPGTFLKPGENEIIIFEHFTPYRYVCFLGDKKRGRNEPVDVPIFYYNNFGVCIYLNFPLILSLFVFNSY